MLEILQVVEALAENPFPLGSARLVGTVDVYRIRVGHSQKLELEKNLL